MKQERTAYRHISRNDEEWAAAMKQVRKTRRPLRDGGQPPQKRPTAKPRRTTLAGRVPGNSPITAYGFPGISRFRPETDSPETP
jgi:hypothetical protein